MTFPLLKAVNQLEATTNCFLKFWHLSDTGYFDADVTHNANLHDFTTFLQ